MIPRFLCSLLGALLLAGCSTFDDAELGLIHRSGVSPRVFAKMQDGRVLSPDDVIELTRRKVPDRYIVRQIEDVGVDYVLHRDDFQRLERARVSRPIIDALVAASEEFANRYAAPRHDVYVGDPYFDDGFDRPYYDRNYVEEGVGIEIHPRHPSWHRRH